MVGKLIVLSVLCVAAIAPLVLYGVIGGPITPSSARIVAIAEIPSFPRGQRFRIAILGTSLTSRGGWVKLLEEKLNRCADYPVQIEKLARPGASSRWGLASLRDHLERSGGRAPDVLIVEFSGNDASPYNGFPLVYSRRYHEKILDIARANGIAVFLATMSPAWGRNAWERPGQARYHALYRDLAREHGTGLIDTIDDWTALSETERDALVPDGLHPTDTAMRAMIVPAFAAALHPIVCAQAGSPGLVEAANPISSGAG